MAVRNTRTARSAPAKKAAPRKAAPAPAPTSKKEPITAYATKAPTEYHKAFARFIVQVIGYDPDAASSKKAAFLRGVAIATAARPAFQASDFIEEWRAVTGEAKRGPKGGEASTPPARRRKPAPEPEPEEVDDEDDFEVDEDEDEVDDTDDDFDSEDDESDDDEESDDDDDDDDDFDEEVAPAPKRRAGRPAKSAPTKPAARGTRTSQSAPARKAAPAKRAAKPADDDDFLMF